MMRLANRVHQKQLFVVSWCRKDHSWLNLLQAMQHPEEARQDLDANLRPHRKRQPRSSRPISRCAGEFADTTAHIAWRPAWSRPSAPKKGGHRSTRLFCVSHRSRGENLTADFNVASTSHDDLHRMATAGPGVGADLTAKQAASPAHRRRLGATARNANRDVLRAAAARRCYAQRGLNGGWWAAADGRWCTAAIVGKTGVCRAEYRAQSDCGKGCCSTKSNHWCPLLVN